MVFYIMRMLRKRAGRLRRDANTAFAILQWLNKMRGKEESRRIVRLLKVATSTQGLSGHGNSPAVDLRTWKSKRTRRQLSNARRFARLTNDLRKLLTNYRFHPKLRPLRRGFYVGWESAAGADAPSIKVYLDGDPFTFGEGDVLLRIVELAGRGRLDRVRECPYCSGWFFARVQHQTYCDRGCQQSNFRTSERFRVHRREYMRGYRRREYERDKKAKELV